MTPRQAEVLRAYAEHGSRKAAAHALGISIYTVRHHLDRLYAELEVNSALGALSALGWICPPDPPATEPEAPRANGGG